MRDDGVPGDTSPEPPRRSPLSEASKRRRKWGGARFRIQVHWTWIITILALIAALGIQRVPSVRPEWPDSATWATAVLTAVLVGTSLVAHEAAHAMAARALGARAVLFRFALAGGAMTTDARALGPRGVALTALAGPTLNAVVAVVFWTLADLLDPSTGNRLSLGWQAAALPVTPVTGTDPSLAQAFALALTDAASINALAGAINLLPIPPLDGGFVIEAITWRLTGRFETALSVSRGLARCLGVLVMLVGLFFFVVGDFAPGALAVILGISLDRLQGPRRTGHH